MELNYQKLIIKQEVEMIEALTGIETKNKYQILNENKERVLYAYEKSNRLARILLKSIRPLEIYFIDNNKDKILKIEKKFAFFFTRI